jgi:hypothetical protein
MNYPANSPNPLPSLREWSGKLRRAVVLSGAFVDPKP